MFAYSNSLDQVLLAAQQSHGSHLSWQFAPFESAKCLQGPAEGANDDPFEKRAFAEERSAPRLDDYDAFGDYDDVVDPLDPSQAQLEGAQQLTGDVSSDDPFGEREAFDAPEAFLEVDDWTMASAESGQEGLIWSAEVRSSAEKILEFIKSGAESMGSADPALLHIHTLMKAIWHMLLTQCTGSQPQFLFKDGPVVEAASFGCHLLLEDLDAPNQAVTERLNSILETERSFRVTENLLLADQPEIDIHQDFQIFATVHQHQPQHTLKLSPAIRSRFTEIAVTGYTSSEIRDVVLQELQQSLPSSQDANMLVNQLFALRSLISAEDSQAFDIHRLMRWINFICNHSNEVSLARRLLLGARFCYLLPGDDTISERLQTSWKDIFGTTTDLSWAQG